MILIKKQCLLVALNRRRKLVMSGHRDALSQPKVRISDQVQLLQLLLLVHVCEVREALLNIIAMLVAGLEVDGLRLVRINLKIDLLFFIFTLIFEHLLNVEAWIILVQAHMLIRTFLLLLVYFEV